MRGARRAGLLRFCFEQLTAIGLRGIWINQEVPPGPFIWAANHHSWWDGFVAAAVLGRHGHRPALLMDTENLARFGFLRSAGALAATEPRAAAQFVRDGASLIVFPEATLRPPGPLATCKPGAAWFARQAGVPLMSAAVRVVLRGHQFPEAYVRLTPTQPTESCLVAVLAEELRTLDAELAAADPRTPLPGYFALGGGRRSWDERLGSLIRRTGSPR